MRQRRSRADARRGRGGAGFIRVCLEDVHLTLLGRKILRGIDWEIRPGQRWALLGANGAGKTLLLKLLAGDVWPTPGHGRRRYYYRGERFDEPVGVKQNVAYIGAERQDRYEHYRWNHRVEAIVGTGLHRTEIPLDPLTDRDRARIARVLRSLGLSAFAGRRFLSLSYGERRLVLLARALASRPKLLLLDELFNGLDAVNRARAQRCLALLSRSALPWVLTGHRSGELPVSVTHRAHLEAGRITVAKLVDGVSAVPAAPAEPRAVRPKARADRARASPGAPWLLRLDNATVWREGRRALRGLSLTIGRGQRWVVHGANGSGKSTLVQLLYGDLSAASEGVVRRAGIEPGVPLTEFKRRAGLVSPELQTLHPRYLRVAEVIASGIDASIGIDGRIGEPERVRVRAVLRRLGLPVLERRTLASLSYGQMRQVLFARALVHEPDILLLDEPYAGLDAPTRACLSGLIDQVIASGVTVVMTTHHREDWPAGTTHELELRDGRALYQGRVRV